MDSTICTYQDAIGINPFTSELRQYCEPWVEPAGWCPYCRNQGSVCFREASPGATAWRCTCGWWDLRVTFQVYVGGAKTIGHTSRFRHAILRSFRTADQSIPIEALRRELTKRPELIHDIHDRKMEELVSGVLSDIFGKCKAEIVGGNRDHGIDIILVPEQRIAVQVKRRMRPGVSEPVAPIREFLGAILLGGFQKGIYVTTASRISKQGLETSKQAVTLQLVKNFDIYDKKRFLELLMAAGHQVKEPWRYHLEALLKSSDDPLPTDNLLFWLLEGTSIPLTSLDGATECNVVEICEWQKLKEWERPEVKCRFYKCIARVNSMPTKANMREMAVTLWRKSSTKDRIVSFTGATDSSKLGIGDNILNKLSGEVKFVSLMYLPGMDIRKNPYCVAEFTDSGLKSLRVDKLSLIGTIWEGR